jgi:heme-degrading monooxygenase HmoA
MSVILINPFTMPAGEVDAFVERFTGFVQAAAGAPGFIGTELCRNVGIGDQTYPVVNIARWESAEAWQAAFRQMFSQMPPLGGAVPKPALYRSVLRYP